MLQLIEEFVRTHADSPLALLIVFVGTVVDGFFPPMPSESLVVGLAGISARTGTPPWPELLAVAAVAAWIGDNLGYLIGRWLGVHWLRRRSEKLSRALDWAERQLERRGAVIIVVARYVPVGRVAVNMICGASGYPQRRFMLLTVLSAVSWAGYAVALGLWVGQFLHNPIAAAAVGIVLALILGFIIDRIVQRLLPDPAKKVADAEVEAEPEEVSVPVVMQDSTQDSAQDSPQA